MGVQSLGFHLHALTNETRMAKLPSTLPVGVEPVLRSSACSPSLQRELNRWVVLRCSACTHQWFLGGVRCKSVSDHDRGRTVSSSSMGTMTSWCEKCSKQEFSSSRELACLPETARKRGDLRHLQHHLHVHQAHEVRQGRAERGGGRAECKTTLRNGAKPVTSAAPSARSRRGRSTRRRARHRRGWAANEGELRVFHEGNSAK